MKPTDIAIWIILAASLQAVQSGSLLAGVGNEDCSTCHAGVFSEWDSSLHSQAWTSPVFSAELEKRRATGETACDCHAPQSVAGATGVKPAMRSESFHSGVDCLACHVDTVQTIWSSGERMYVPHFTMQEPAYATAKVCSSCHPVAKDNEYDCQVCHMPEIDGGAADGPYMEYLPGDTHRSHRVTGSRDPELIGSGLEMKVESSGAGVRVTVTNLVDAHQVPVSGHHRLVVALSMADAGGAVRQERLTLEPGGQAELDLNPAGATGVELRFYPGPEVWPDSFYVIQREVLN